MADQVRIGRARLAVTLVAAIGTGLIVASPAAALTFFRSPSGNVGCLLTKQYARCDIAKRTWSPPPKPASCELDYGQGVIVGKRGKGRFVCAGDTALNPNARRLAYGDSIRRGRFRCTSRRSGMRCRNLRNEHGFQLARERVRRF